MQIDAQLVRDLFACCRKMQQALHFINGQALALELFHDDKEKVKLIKGNIEKMTMFIYDGEAGFPDVAKTLEMTRGELEAQNEWMSFSDYVGFRLVEGAAK